MSHDFGVSTLLWSLFHTENVPRPVSNVTAVPAVTDIVPAVPALTNISTPTVSRKRHEPSTPKQQPTPCKKRPYLSTPTHYKDSIESQLFTTPIPREDLQTVYEMSSPLGFFSQFEPLSACSSSLTMPDTSLFELPTFDLLEPNCTVSNVIEQPDTRQLLNTVTTLWSSPKPSNTF